MVGLRLQLLCQGLSLAPHPTHSPLCAPFRCSLVLMGRQIAGPLPDIHPGALPQLLHLEIEATELASSLPASWGDPAVLPSLLLLTLTLRMQGGLPPAWARGFRRLLSLHIGQDQPSWRHRSLPRPQGSSLRLPPEWASSAAFPMLKGLELVGLPLGGSLPTEWVQGGFPSLNKL